MRKRTIGLVVCLGVAALGAAFSYAVAFAASQVTFDNYDVRPTLVASRELFFAYAQFDVTTNEEAGVDSLCFFLHDEFAVYNICDTTGLKFAYTEKKVDYSLNYSLSANKVCVKLNRTLAKGDTLSMYVFYSGKVTPNPIKSAADFMRFTKEGFFVRGPGSCLWFPTTASAVEDLNQPVHMAVEVYAPDTWKALAEGELESVTRPGEVKLAEGEPEPKVGIGEIHPFRWVTKGKIPLSSAVLMAADYDTLSARVGSETVSFWHFDSPEDSTAAVGLFGTAKEVAGFFEKNYGDYRSSDSPHRFTMVETPVYGDFFSGTIMGLSKGFVREAKTKAKQATLSSLIASKMVRDFTVPAVDSAWPGAAFLLESVPSYAYVPAIEAVYGKSFVVESSENVIKKYAERRKLGEKEEETGVGPEPTLASLRASDIPRYKDAFLFEGRGAYVLHMMRRLIGDESFFVVMRSYLASFAEQPSGERPPVPPGFQESKKRARLEDFVQIAEAASGRRLDWFFSEWLYGDVLPDYRIADMRVSVSHDTTFVDVKVENTGTGLMPVPVTLFTSKGQRTSEVWLAAHESAEMRFISKSQPKRVEIDAQKWILQSDISNDGMDVTLPKQAPSKQTLPKPPLPKQSPAKQPLPKGTSPKQGK